MTSPKIIQEIGSKVSYTEAQSLSNEQKTQTRQNLGIVSYETQSLTDSQKAQSRTNIGATSSTDVQSAISNSAVKYSESQTLTGAQKAQARANIGADSLRNIGEIVTSTLPLTDAGLHLLDGSLIQGSGIYADFVSYIGSLYENDPTAAYFTDEASWQSSVTTYGVCGKFVYDSVNDTVRLPKLTGITEGTTDLTALGDLVQAGLPNITGSFIPDPANGSACVVYGYSGAFTNKGTGTITTFSQSGTTTSAYGVNIDASRSSSIYGNSSTVQPQTIKTLVYIVIATVTKTDIQVDIDNIVTDLNNKVDLASPQTITGNKNFTGALQQNGHDVVSVVAQSLALDSRNYLNGYIRFSNGVQICIMRGLSDASDTYLTFSAPFTSIPNMVASANNTISPRCALPTATSPDGTTAIILRIFRTTTGNQEPSIYSVFAIGYWK